MTPRVSDHALPDLLRTAEAAARQGGEILLQIGSVKEARTKSPRNLVTEADLASQAAIMQWLRDACPGHAMVGEESSPVTETPTAEDEWTWVIDPLDGTTNFVHGIPFYCVSVGLLKGTTPLVGAIYDPLRDEMFSGAVGLGAFLNERPIGPSHCAELEKALVACSFAAEARRDSRDVTLFLNLLPHARAIRRMGSAALNLAYVTAGRLDACWAASTNAWDVTAGVAMALAAGAKVTDLAGRLPAPLDDASVLVAATSMLHDQLSQSGSVGE